MPVLQGPQELLSWPTWALNCRHLGWTDWGGLHGGGGLGTYP